MKSFFYYSFIGFIFALYIFSNSEAHAISVIIDGENSCENISGAIWSVSSNTCTITMDNFISVGDTWTIDSGVELTIISDVKIILQNGGTISNLGTLNNLGTIQNNSAAVISNSGIIQNFSLISNNGLIGNNGVVFNNFGGIISNFDSITNSGSITNHCGSSYSGNPPLNNPLLDDCDSCFPVSNWIVSSSCQLLESVNVSGNVIIQNNSILIIPNGKTLDIDFTVNHLLIKSGSVVLIKAGGNIK